MHRTQMVTTSRSATPSSPLRAPVRSVGTGASLPLEFDVRTAFDFALSLAAEVGQQDELPEQDRRWLQESRATLPATDGMLVDDDLCIHGASLLIDRPDVKDAAGYV